MSLPLTTTNLKEKKGPWEDLESENKKNPKESVDDDESEAALH